MDPELKHLLEKNIELNEQNNAMLKRLTKALRWNQFWGIVKWTIIIGSAIGAYYWLQPVLQRTLEGYETLLGANGVATNGVPTATSSAFTRLLDKIR